MSKKLAKNVEVAGTLWLAGTVPPPEVAKRIVATDAWAKASAPAADSDAKK